MKFILTALALIAFIFMSPDTALAKGKGMGGDGKVGAQSGEHGSSDKGMKGKRGKKGDKGKGKGKKGKGKGNKGNKGRDAPSPESGDAAPGGDPNAGNSRTPTPAIVYEWCQSPAGGVTNVCG